MNCDLIQRVTQYAKLNNWQAIMKEAQYKYDIRPYKIQKLSPEEVQSLYHNVLSKYDKKDFRLSSTYWQENQRRIFIWFLVFYCHFSKKQPIQINQSEWEQLSSVFFKKNTNFLEFHCKNIIKYKTRPIWSTQQDQILTETIQNYPIGKWNEVAKQIFFKTNKYIFRTPKQCRQRWYNHLDTSKDKSQWTQAQDTIIVSFVNQYGKKWAQIVKQLNNKRTEHMIKNRYNSLLRKFKKYKNQSQKQVFRMMVETMCSNIKGSIQSNQMEDQQQLETGIKQINKGFQIYVDKSCEQSMDKLQANQNQQFNLAYCFNLNLQIYQNWLQHMMSLGLKLPIIEQNVNS